MRKKPSLPPRPLPPLSVQALDEVERVEEFVQDALLACDENPEKAVRILRTMIVKSLDVQMDYYLSLPTYDAVWAVDVAGKTVDSMIRLFPPLTSGEHFRGELFRTSIDHLVQKLGDANNKAATAAPPESDGNDREALKKAYLAKFPGAVILDICFAAGEQHYSEWKRWLRNAVKDGSAPDRAFRAILTSGKMPGEYRKQPRPKGWK
jgi:hypothetical protein